jgi:SAM-dependent methyltransferase
VSEILRKYKEHLEGAGAEGLYQPIDDPIFEGWEVTQPCKERWGIIHQSIPRTSIGTAIDIGCHTGWFCRKFADLGWKVDGIDKKAREIEVAKELGGGPEYYHGEAQYFQMGQGAYDVALCLSVVMYWFNPQFGMTTGQAWQLMDDISRSASFMFMDYGGMYSTLGESFPMDIIEHTQFGHYILLGHSALEDRPIYVFGA